MRTVLVSFYCNASGSYSNTMGEYKPPSWVNTPTLYPVCISENASNVDSLGGSIENALTYTVVMRDYGNIIWQSTNSSAIKLQVNTSCRFTVSGDNSGASYYVNQVKKSGKNLILTCSRFLKASQNYR